MGLRFRAFLCFRRRTGGRGVLGQSRAWGLRFGVGIALRFGERVSAVQQFDGVQADVLSVSE